MKSSNTLQAEQTIVAIGTSTGGPRALQRMLKDLPEDFPAPIVIVQHMPKGFTKSLAERLDRESNLIVKEASHRDKLKPGHAYIAPGDYHMRLQSVGYRVEVELTKEAFHLGHRPAVDILFKSLSELDFVQKFAIVLTGMGKDGAQGVNLIKQADPHATIIAESHESAIIDGMPKSTIDTGLVTQILHLNDIGTTLCKIVKRRS